MAKQTHTCTHCDKVLCATCRDDKTVHGLCHAVAVAADVVRAMVAKEPAHVSRRLDAC